MQTDVDLLVEAEKLRAIEKQKTWRKLDEETKNFMNDIASVFGKPKAIHIKFSDGTQYLNKNC